MTIHRVQALYHPSATVYRRFFSNFLRASELHPARCTNTQYYRLPEDWNINVIVVSTGLDTGWQA